jgi:hypothetical protein
MTLGGLRQPGFVFPLRYLFKKTQEIKGGIVVAKTLAKLTFGVAALAAATGFGSSSGLAYGDAPWCAVINIGTGTVPIPHIRGVLPFG